MCAKRKKIQEKKKELMKEVVKILVTALVTSVATCCVWGVQTRSENKREDKYKKIELIQEYVELNIRFDQTYSRIIDNKQSWLQAILLSEYLYENNQEYEGIDTFEFQEKEEIYRSEYRDILAEYYGLLSTIDILFELDEEVDICVKKMQEELQRGFGLEHEKYIDYFWNQVETMGGSVSEEEMLAILEEVDKMSNEDCANNFLYYSQQYLNSIRKLVKKCN